MQFFSNFSVAKRLYLLNLVAAIGLIILSAITIYQTTHDLKAQADSELKHLTETATTLIAGYHERAKSGKMTEAQAKTAAAAAVSKIRCEGKGFAVVATEVKSLADQTALATEEIGSQVSAIQSATTGAVAAIGGISTTIDQVSGIASSVSAAVTEQGASTNEIAQSVQHAATGTQEVSSNIAGVTQAASETGGAAEGVLEATKELNQQTNILRNAVDGFLEKIKAA